MTKYKDCSESVDTDQSTLSVSYFWTVKCDACGEERTVEDSNGVACTEQLPFWYADDQTNNGQGFHLCASCRYAGAGKYLAENQITGNAVGVEIAGALWSVFRNLTQTKVNHVSQAGYTIEQYMHETDDRQRALSELTQAYYNLQEMHSLIGIVINELNRLGWPIPKAYAIKAQDKTWPKTSKKFNRG